MNVRQCCRFLDFCVACMHGENSLLHSCLASDEPLQLCETHEVAKSALYVILITVGG